MEIIEKEDYGQFVDLTPCNHVNSPKYQSTIDYIYNHTTNSKYSAESINHTFSENYQNLVHEDIYTINIQPFDNKKEWSPLWLCCKLLTRNEILENCVIPACITVGTVYIVWKVFS
jgi:hypothetical protein